MIGNTAELIAFAESRGVIIQELDAAVALQKASDYINAKEWIGEVMDLLQADAWPRVEFRSPGGAFEQAGTMIGIKRGEWITDPVTPRAIIDAAYMLAMASAAGIPLGESSDGKEFIRAKVSVIEVEYDKSTLGQTATFPWWDKLVGVYEDSYGCAAQGDVLAW